MSVYEELIELRNRMSESNFELFEEDVQLIDRFLDDHEKKDQQIAEPQAKLQDMKNQIVDFIYRIAWEDAEYDAMQSTMGEFHASLSATPRYAKKYFDLWKDMFHEDLLKKYEGKI